jgi:beta-glucosidase
MRAIVALPLLALASAAAAQTPDYLDPALPVERRVDDLVGRMTIEEKVGQMVDQAPAIERLGVPEYNWWNEALHGVARSGLATVFPQAIGMAATWDDSLVFREATVISDEARAKHHEYARKGKRLRYQGLTIWSPNINLFRDPRWGRGQETYGEDPYLTGSLAVQFVRGLQGDDPRYLKTVATVKHFAVHSGPEPERHEFDVSPTERDLHEYYLPQFERAVREGGAYSAMCAYNRLYGEPACSSDLLLGQILRGAWEFPGYVVSDCDAISDIWRTHHAQPDAAAASAVAVKAGTDLDCGPTYGALTDAVSRGLISEAQIDTAVKRLFTARFRLGMFDPDSMVAYARIPYSTLDGPEHRALALRAARESMVLLKNEPVGGVRVAKDLAGAGGRPVLPLRKDLGTLAVIGPNADQWLMLLGNYNGVPSDVVTPLRGIREAVSPSTEVIYARGAELAEGFPMYDVVPGRVLRTPEGAPGLEAEYFGDRERSGAPLFTGTDSVLDANWHDRAPRAGMDDDDFGVRWTGTIRPERSGTYRLGAIGTMKFQLFLDDSLVARSTYGYRDEFGDPRVVPAEAVTLQAGRDYRLRVEAGESYGDAQLQLVWAAPQGDLEAEALDAARRADAVVLFLGLTPRLEGEEMRVETPGFRGGDRTRLDLPATQRRLLERVTVLGKPTVLVLLNGSALAVDWAQEHVPAILEAWYPGQAAGTAIADVLFGDYNPGGRLPVTFYRSVDDLPAFTDYATGGRTYRYFDGTPLYPFGHGRSYTTFEYANLRVAGATLAAGDSLPVRVDVTNTGARSGDEVVQVYVRYPGSRVERPRQQLVGYRRITLQPGETRTVSLPLRADDLRYWDADADRWVLEPAPLRVLVGASSADIRAEATVEVGDS